MKLLKAVPILAFLDSEATVKFYKSIGFTCNANWPDYIMCSRDEIEIHLWKCDDPAIPKNTGCYIRVQEIDILYKECQQLNIIHPNGLLENKPWGMRQFSILDNSGNILNIGEYL